MMPREIHVSYKLSLGGSWEGKKILRGWLKYGKMKEERRGTQWKGENKKWKRERQTDRQNLDV